MKSKYQIFIFLITIFLFLNIYINSSAASNDYFYNEAKILEKNGLLKGDNNGDLLLGDELNKQDIIILISRLLNEEPSEKNLSDKIVFKDVQKDAYYTPYIIWAVNKGIAQGISQDEFGIDKKITVKELETILLRILGYTEEAKKWNLIENLSKSLGIRDHLDFNTNRPILRGEMSRMIINTLLVQKKGSTLKLKDILNIDIEEE